MACNDCELWQPGDDYAIILFYRYLLIEEPEQLVLTMQQLCQSLGLLGRILIATEGINGTLAGSVSCINYYVSYMKRDSRFFNIDWKYSYSSSYSDSHSNSYSRSNSHSNSSAQNSDSNSHSYEDSCSNSTETKVVGPERSKNNNDSLPFLGLSIRVTKEIVSCGTVSNTINKAINYDNNTFGGITGTGKHLTPKEFHDAISAANICDSNSYGNSYSNCDDTDANSNSAVTVNNSNKKLNRKVILDIRNEFEHDIGHFENAIGIKTYTYSETFTALDNILPALINNSNSDSNSNSGSNSNNSNGDCNDTTSSNNDCHSNDKNNIHSVDTDIYMYCTGGIRCEKASAYLCSKGYKNVYQLQGGIHRYLEEFPNGGKFLGKNFVFDSRVAVAPTTGNSPDLNQAGVAVKKSNDKNVIGKCIDCSTPYDQYSGYVVCTVCRMPVLVCISCVTNRKYPGEYHCSRHRDLKLLYFTVLDRFSIEELETQKSGLQKLLDDQLQHKNLLHKKKHQNNQNKSVENEIITDYDTYSHDDENKSITSDVYTISSKVSITHTNSSKNRRKTISKQIERINQRIRILSSKLLLENDNATITDSDTNPNDTLPINPMVRGGWGFWKN